ncbi:MAG: MGMT family protein [Ornithinimicrobium sp.]
MDEWLAEKVLLAVERIPVGRVASYGDIAEIVGIGPRHVGNVLRTYGSGVAWWRVVSRDGDFGGDLLDRARPHWDDEDIVVKPNGLGCRIEDYRADLCALAQAYDEALASSADPSTAPTGRTPEGRTR